MKRIVILNMVICVILCFILSGCEVKMAKTEMYEAESVEQAVFEISGNDFNNGDFSECQISDKEIIDYKKIVQYDNLTETGVIYVYELHYKIKTNDPNLLITEKITGKPCPTNEWLSDVIAKQCIIIYNVEDTYYDLQCISNLDFPRNGSFFYDSEYNRASLEYMIISNVFKHKDVADLKLSPDATSYDLLKKLIWDIEMIVRPNYNIDINKCRLYDISYDYDIDCIYFKADLYTDDNKLITENKGFSMFWFQSGGEIETLPKVLN